MASNKMKIGIMPKAAYRKRTIDIAKGKYKPKKGDPKIWFDSIQSMAQVLSEENRKLLELISIHKPRSLVELEELSNRKKSNLSRTLKTLQSYKIVTIDKSKGTVVPKVKATDFMVEFSIQSEYSDEYKK